jgi:hypothetical protein
MKDEKFIALIEIRDELIRKLQHFDSSITNQLKTILSILDEYQPSINNSQIVKAIAQDTLFEDPADLSPRMMKPVQAVKKFFLDRPGGKFTPPGIRDYLKQLKANGELEHKGKDLLITTHTALHILYKQKFIDLIKLDGGSPIYFLRK